MAKRKQKPKKKKIVSKPKRSAPGQPTKYTKAIGQAICDMIRCTNLSLTAILQKMAKDGFVEVTAQTVMNWLNTHEEFFEEYARAKEDQADYLAERMLDVADEAARLVITRKISNFKASAYMQAVKLQIDVMKFHASKLKPKRYGDKLDVTSKGKELKGMTVIVQNEKQKKSIEEIG